MKKLVNVSLSIVLTGLLYVSCKGTQEVDKTDIVLTNSSSFTLTDKAVSIDRTLLKINNEEVKKYPLLMVISDTIPSQLVDTDDNGEWDEIFFVTNFSAKETKNITLTWLDAPPNYVVRTSARFGKRSSKTTPVQPALEETLTRKELPKSLGYQQYQTDGPSWENDKVGFRHYLDGRNAKDLFGKTTSKMSPEDVGINDKGAVEDNYHVMESWGRDIMSVGNSVGLGGYALITDSELMRLGVTVNDSINNIEKTTFKIQTEGPVESILTYDYQNWQPNERTYSVKEKTSIWPGMYGYKNTVAVSGLQGDENLAVGLVNINNDDPLNVWDENSNYVVLYTHDKQTYNKEWWLGMAIILPKDKYVGYTEAPKKGDLTNTFLAKLKIENNQPVSYFAVACWELSDSKFVDKAYFENYIKQLTNQLSAKIGVEIKN
ncbi:DUF4861 domain-containing protein [Wenyingzhuangia marina]|uniref:DUF4861 domain-containing protein n=1 Tax=Wenyingzhuangia marina TaxID=1195760 RepID=A0A1M5WHL2_9FLAO|nr:DUF4861 domain-containing protein [Wenyingzhuangia marina]GGF80821.1 hypothetical protein GCM10011397_24770 [Wenyingzhuangia marina]SHH87021.1 protein of unknown function [Wenyingzhuangia marina]